MGFLSWNAYRRFAHEVRTRNRYILSDESKAFLEEVGRGAKEHEQLLEVGSVLWRAQLGHDWWMHEQDGVEMGEIECPYPESRMLPEKHRASEGRVNPRGIPCFYAASDRTTALSEVRPWVGAKVSVGCFHTLRDLKIVDCSDLPEHERFYLSKDDDGLFRESEEPKGDEIVWEKINLAFSEPTDNDHGKADYAPTQMIAEVWRQAGYDGICYKSKLGPGVNIALFDLEAVEIKHCEIHEVEAVAINYRKCGNGWFKKEGAPRGEMTSLYVSSLGPKETSF